MDEKIVKLSGHLQGIVDLTAGMSDKHAEMVDELCSSILAVFADDAHIPMHTTVLPDGDGTFEISPGVFATRSNGQVSLSSSGVATRTFSIELDPEMADEEAVQFVEVCKDELSKRQ